MIIRKIDGRIFRQFLQDVKWLEVGHDKTYQYYLTPAGIVVKVKIANDQFMVMETFLKVVKK